MGPQKKVLYVITKPNWGGAQKYVFMLARTAHKAGYDIVVATGGTGVLTDHLAAEGIRSVPIPMRQRRSVLADLLTFGPLFSLIRLFRAERPDVVHLNSAKAGGLGALAARIARVPCIIFTAHGWEMNAPRPLMARALITFFSWLTVMLSHRTIAVSEQIQKQARSWPLVASRFIVIKNGITCPALLTRADARARLQLDPQTSPVIGMASELIPTKNVMAAIEAMREITERYPDAKLIVFGEGPERARLTDSIAKFGLSGAVTLAGFVEDGTCLFAAFDVFLHTSRSEALSLAILEAGCAGLPVVASRVGGIPEIIEDGASGFLVQHEDVHGFVSALEKLIEDKELAHTLGANLHERVAHAFSETRMMRETIALYDSAS